MHPVVQSTQCHAIPNDYYEANENKLLQKQQHQYDIDGPKVRSEGKRTQRETRISRTERRQTHGQVKKHKKKTTDLGA